MANYQDDNKCGECGGPLDPKSHEETDTGVCGVCAKPDPLRFSPAWWNREAWAFEAERNKALADGYFYRYPGYGGLRGG